MGEDYWSIFSLITQNLAQLVLTSPQQGENRVKSMLFHMSGEGALLTACSKRRSPPG
eukprot:COSAG01_NODE_73362_length_247_cov_6.047297_1_plen_56_part_01